MNSPVVEVIAMTHAQYKGVGIDLICLIILQP